MNFRDMDAGNRWLSHGYSTDARDKTIIDRIMLRFRPIAPKPTADGSASGSVAGTNKAEPVSKQRKKRKYVRVKKTRRCKVGEKQESKDLEGPQNIVALELMPEMSSLEVLTATGSSLNLDLRVEKGPIWMNFNESENNRVLGAVGVPDQADRTAVSQPGRVVESWVMVDGMTDMWLDKGGLGCTDTEKMRNLEVDSCPGLISDGSGRVQWVNPAYKRLVVAPTKDVEPPPEVVVWLVVKEKIPVLWQAFACTVRVVFTWRKEKQTKTMPCDVWKMDFGGYAWRLDSKAALSLGL